MRISVNFSKIDYVNWLKVTLGLTFGYILFLSLSLVMFPLPSPKPYSTMIMAKDSTLLCAYLSTDDKWRMETKVKDIHPQMIKAIIAKEDQWFYLHPGVNLFAIGRALWRNITSGKRTSGASTITMQLARMLEPGERTYSKKLQECFRALQLEWKYDKNTILELYLSHLPYGGNVEGISAASYIFFNRPPNQLSLSQSILLAVIPNRPNSLRLDRNQQAAMEARDLWIERFRKNRVFSQEELNTALEESIASLRFQIIPKAPQYCQYVKRKARGQTTVHTYLDPSVQSISQNLLRNHVQRSKSNGVSNGAVIVIDNHSKEVLSYCGSADFNDFAALGQVDGVRAVRSPGSTLKTAAFALGLDLGLVSPEKKVLDVPTNYEGYTPENYDLTYSGYVSVSHALRHSLNIPPVRLVQQLGVQKMIETLIDGRFETISKRADDLGLSVILGGCGVTLEELSRFYTCFSNEGRLGDIHYIKGAPTTEEQQIFSAESAYLIGDILSNLERPDLPQSFIASSTMPKIAWKTGTTYGNRDAWSIGFSPRFTVGVWMGNFDGKGIPGLSGTATAVPLLLDIFDAIDTQSGQAWFDQPTGIAVRNVCSITGLAMGKDCNGAIPEHYIRNAADLKPCTLYENLFVSLDEKVKYCSECLPKEGFKQKAYPLYEPELALWYDMEKVDYPRPPKHNPKCQALFSGKGPVIISPSPDFTYHLEKGSDQKIMLQATSEPGTDMHYWYVNNQYIDKGKPGEKIFYEPVENRLQVACLDDRGRRTEIVVEIERY